MNKWNSLQGKLLLLPSKCWTGPEIWLHLTTLHVGGGEGEAGKEAAEYALRDQRERLPPTQGQKNPLGWGEMLLSYLFLGSLFLIDLNLQISSWEINYSDGYSNMPQMSQEVKNPLIP